MIHKNEIQKVMQIESKSYIQKGKRNLVFYMSSVKKDILRVVKVSY